MLHPSAVDLGFWGTKAIVNGRRILIKSTVGNRKKLQFQDLDFGMNGDKDKIISGDYFVSDLAIDQSDVVLHSLKPNRFDSEATKVLLDTVLGMGYKGGRDVSYVVSGLPVSHHETFKGDIAKLFLGGEHSYSVTEGSGHYEGSVKFLDGKFIPQPFGAMMDRLLNADGSIADAQLAGKVVAIIEPGFGTTDVYVTDALSPVQRLIFSTQTAMNYAYRMVAGNIQESFDVVLKLHEVHEVIQTGRFRKSGKVYDMTQAVVNAYKSTAEQLVAEVYNKWKSVHQIDHILLGGGGGIALSDYILPEFENIELLRNPQWAVVEGYLKWARRSWKGLLN